MITADRDVATLYDFADYYYSIPFLELFFFLVWSLSEVDGSSQASIITNTIVTTGYHGREFICRG